MAIKERLLQAITSVSDSDFVRLVTSEGASRKALVSDVAKQIIENYTGSTIAGTEQSVKSAIDTAVVELKPKHTDVTATTTSAGEFAIPFELRSKPIIDVYPVNLTGFTAVALRRDTNYFVLKKSITMEVIASQSVTLRIWHF